jgi:serine/threonine protein phosphatase 1
MAAARTIVIGDIHGCDAALARLLAEIAPTANDLIVTLGDYVDRGPNAKSVIQRLINLQHACRVVNLMGNHELMMLSALDNSSELDFWLASGGQATVASYDESLENVPAAHLEFLSQCLPFFELESYFFVHANYTPGISLDKQPDFALYWEHLTAYTPEQHLSGKTAIVGHTPQRDGRVLDLGHLLCIDTFCYGGGWLTALDVNSRQVWQANMQGELREAEDARRKDEGGRRGK